MRKNIERSLYEEVIIGFDDQTMNIGVKKYDGNENVKSYKFYSRMKNGWERIGCKEFIKYLSLLTGLEFSPAIRYIAKYDEQEELLYISVWGALQSQKTRRRMKISKLIKAH